MTIATTHRARFTGSVSYTAGHGIRDIVAVTRLQSKTVLTLTCGCTYSLEHQT